MSIRCVCVCVCSLVFVIWHANRVLSAPCYIANYDLSGATIFFHIIPRTAHSFWRKFTELEMPVLIFSKILSATFLILRRIQRDIIVDAQRYSREVPVILCQILMKLEFSLDWFSKKIISVWIFVKICLFGAELLHADRRTDRQTDMTKLIVAFRNFTKAHLTYLPQRHISHMKEQFLVTHRYTVLQQTERTRTMFSRPTLKRYIRTSNLFFCGHSILTEGVYVAQMSRNTRIPFWRFLWVTTNCCVLSDLFH